MSKLLLNPDVVASLKNVTECAELCDEMGKTIGFFMPSIGDRYGFIEPTSEELDQRSQESEEFNTSEVLESLARIGKA